MARTVSQISRDYFGNFKDQESMALVPIKEVPDYSTLSPARQHQLKNPFDMRLGSSFMHIGPDVRGRLQKEQAVQK